MIVVIVCVCIVVAVMIVVTMLCYDYEINEWRKINKLKFDRFLSFYNIAPDKWYLCNNTVKYKIFNSRSYPEYRKFRFGIIDTIRYRVWHEWDTKRKETRKQNEEMAEFLKCVKKDIEAYQAKNEQKTAEDLKEIWNRGVKNE